MTMLRSGAAPVRTSLVFFAMTPTDLEAMVKKLDQRVTSIEQILPTLATKKDLERFATKEELRQEINGLRTEMQALSEGDRRYALVLHEELRSQIGLIAEHLAEVMSRLPRRPH